VYPMDRINPYAAANAEANPSFSTRRPRRKRSGAAHLAHERVTRARVIELGAGGSIARPLSATVKNSQSAIASGIS